jgi:hypothetical protein
MTKTIWTTTCAAIVGTATAAVIAQSAPSQQTQTNTSGDRRIIVTGCLAQVAGRSADAAPAGTATPAAAGTAGVERTADSAPTDADAVVPTFLVINASIEAADGDSGDTNRTAAESTTSPGRTYRIVGNAALLSEHVGETVEVTGTLEAQKSPAAASANAAPGAEASLPIVRLQTGKTLAAACGKDA